MIPGKSQNLEITMNRIVSKFGATRIRSPLKSTPKLSKTTRKFAGKMSFGVATNASFFESQLANFLHGTDIHMVFNRVARFKLIR